ncbi:Insulin enhancer -like protein [Halotydeus destructor]|nr:Insulin enhancer -like protein [Halotydeus destructor]
MIEAKGTVSRLELSLPGFGHSGGGRSPSRSMGDINGNSVSPGSNSNASSTGQLQLSGNSDSVVVQSSHGRHHRESSRHGHGKGSEHKPTRVRTVLNEKQLLTLRTCYNANPRPDALMKEQLVDMTGLSPRVIRVWFQNKRCKDKKRNILMKQMAQQEKDGRQLQNIVNMRGVPLVAGSPMRHESPVQHGLEVQSYHPPWKTFADYAMQPDMDPNGPHFQHLVSQMHGYDHHHMPPGPPPGSEAHLMSLHGNGPPNGPCTPLSYLEHDLHNPHSNLSSQIPGSPSELSSPCTSE